MYILFLIATLSCTNARHGCNPYVLYGCILTNAQFTKAPWDSVPTISSTKDRQNTQNEGSYTHPADTPMKDNFMLPGRRRR